MVNATGVWSDDIRAFDEGTHPNSIRPAKGIHITVPWEKVRNDIAAIVPVPKDKRSIFVVPWGDFTYIGTTDTDYDGPLDDPECTPEDIDYLLNAMNLVMTEPLTKDDIVGTWAGLRPLIAGGSVGEKTADLSRGHKVLTSPSGARHRHRRQAHDLPADGLGHGRRGRRSARPGRQVRDQEAAAPRRRVAGPRSRGRPTTSTWRGATAASRARSWTSSATRPSLATPLVAGLPYRRSEAIYAVRDEMATTLDDVLSRRTRARLLGRDATAAAAEAVAQLIAPELGWDEARIARGRRLPRRARARTHRAGLGTRHRAPLTPHRLTRARSESTRARPNRSGA